MFQLYEAVQAQVRIDEVRLMGDQAWIYSTGQVLGLLPWFGSWMTLLDWQHEPSRTAGARAVAALWLPAVRGCIESGG